MLSSKNATMSGNKRSDFKVKGLEYTFPAFEGERPFQEKLRWAAERFDEVAVECAQKISHLNALAISEIPTTQVLEVREALENSERNLREAFDHLVEARILARRDDKNDKSKEAYQLILGVHYSTVSGKRMDRFKKILAEIEATLQEVKARGRGGPGGGVCGGSGVGDAPITTENGPQRDEAVHPNATGAEEEADEALGLDGDGWPTWCTDGVYFPPEFRGKRRGGVERLTEMPSFHANEDGDTVVMYRGETFSGLEEWSAYIDNMDRQYPNIVRKCPDSSRTHTKFEYNTDRKETTDKEIREYCWQALYKSDTPLFERPNPETRRKEKEYLWGQDLNIKKILEDKFRLDMYGNVVSCDADTSGALTAFDVDHLFPWSRGGRSVRDNFAAVHYAANRWAKSDKLIPMLNCRECERIRENNCLRGFSRTQFYNLFEYALKVAGSDGQVKAKGKDKRLLETSFRSRMKAKVEEVATWLTHGCYTLKKEGEHPSDDTHAHVARPRRVPGIHLKLLRREREDVVEDEVVELAIELKYGLVSDIQAAVRHTTDGEQLYKILERRFAVHVREEGKRLRGEGEQGAEGDESVGVAGDGGTRGEGAPHSPPRVHEGSSGEHTEGDLPGTELLPLPSVEGQLHESTLEPHSPPPRAPDASVSHDALSASALPQVTAEPGPARDTQVRFRVVRHLDSGQPLYVDCVEGSYHLHMKLNLKKNFGWEFMNQATPVFWRYDVGSEALKTRSLASRLRKSVEKAFFWREKKVSCTDPRCVQRLREALEKMEDDTFVLTMKN